MTNLGGGTYDFGSDSESALANAKTAIVDIQTAAQSAINTLNSAEQAETDAARGLLEYNELQYKLGTITKD